MKKALLTALVISASVCTAFAQETKTSPAQDNPVAKEAGQKSDQAKKAQDWQHLVVTELKLSEEQLQKIAEMDKAFGERRVAIHNNTTLTDEAKAERKAALLKAREAQFVKLLTPEQQVKYAALLESRK